MNIPDEALRRYPPTQLVEDYEGDRYVDDEWGYDLGQRNAFIAGAEWARREAFREAAQYIEELHARTRYTGAFGIHLVRNAIRALAEGDSNE